MTKAIGAYGSTIVLAPGWSSRMNIDESALFDAFLTAEGLAILVNMELSMRSARDIGPTCCADAARILCEANAGGSSRISEALAMDVLARAFGATLLKTELELVYWPSGSPITDFSVSMRGGCELGVSVTRAVGPLVDKAWGSEGVDAAERLLRKKLRGVLESTRTCCSSAWRKQLLFVWSRGVAADLEIAYSKLESELTADTVVLVVECDLVELFEEKASRAVASPGKQKVCKGLKDADHLRILQESDPCRPRLGLDAKSRSALAPLGSAAQAQSQPLLSF